MIALTVLTVLAVIACALGVRQWRAGVLAEEDRDGIAQGAEAESRLLLGRALTAEEIEDFERRWREQWAAQEGVRP